MTRYIRVESGVTYGQSIVSVGDAGDVVICGRIGGDKLGVGCGQCLDLSETKNLIAPINQFRLKPTHTLASSSSKKVSFAAASPARIDWRPPSIISTISEKRRFEYSRMQWFYLARFRIEA